jgi:hypothetical protein
VCVCDMKAILCSYRVGHVQIVLGQRSFFYVRWLLTVKTDESQANTVQG